VAIRSLADLYSDAANRRDVKAMAAVYAEDGELVAFGQAYRGRGTIEQVFVETMERLEFVNQICGAGVLQVDGDRATSRWTVTEFTKRPDNEKLQLFLGTYEDELVRTPHGWRFARRMLSRRAQTRFEGVLRR